MPYASSKFLLFLGLFTCVKKNDDYSRKDVASANKDIEVILQIAINLDALQGFLHSDIEGRRILCIIGTGIPGDLTITGGDGATSSGNAHGGDINITSGTGGGTFRGGDIGITTGNSASGGGGGGDTSNFWDKYKWWIIGIIAVVVILIIVGFVFSSKSSTPSTPSTDSDTGLDANSENNN